MYSNVLSSLNNFMLIGNNLNDEFYSNKFKVMQTQLKDPEIQDPDIQEVAIAPHRNELNDIFTVRQFDSLFWTLYIIKNGLFHYEISTKTQSFAIEKNTKFEYIQLLRQNKDILKLHKIKNLPSLENELANERRISIKTFFAICAVENINMCLVDGQKIHLQILDESLPTNIVLKDVNNSKYLNYCIDFQNTDENLNTYKNDYLIINSFEDKLKSISSYNMNELNEICRKLKLTIPTKNGKKLTKPELYLFVSENYN